MNVQETQRMLQKPDPGISATPHEDNLRYFNVIIAGPQDSAYDGAICVVILMIDHFSHLYRQSKCNG